MEQVVVLSQLLGRIEELEKLVHNLVQFTGYEENKVAIQINSQNLLNLSNFEEKEIENPRNPSNYNEFQGNNKNEQNPHGYDDNNDEEIQDFHVIKQEEEQVQVDGIVEIDHEIIIPDNNIDVDIDNLKFEQEAEDDEIQYSIIHLNRDNNVAAAASSRSRRTSSSSSFSNHLNIQIPQRRSINKKKKFNRTTKADRERDPLNLEDAAANANQLNCTICGKGPFSKMRNLLIHRKSVHSGTKSYVCREDGCTSAFASPMGRSQHVKRVHRDKPWKCELCDQFFPRENMLKIHLEFKHSISQPSSSSSLFSILP